MNEQHLILVVFSEELCIRLMVEDFIEGCLDDDYIVEAVPLVKVPSLIWIPIHPARHVRDTLLMGPLVKGIPGFTSLVTGVPALYSPLLQPSIALCANCGMARFSKVLCGPTHQIPQMFCSSTGTGRV